MGQVRGDQRAGSPQEARVCIEASSALERAIANEADHNATGIRLFEKGETVLEVVGMDEGWHAEMYDPNAPCQLEGGRIEAGGLRNPCASKKNQAIVYD
jgi:hypothetical protein